jgi:hypothetical protein
MMEPELMELGTFSQQRAELFLLQKNASLPGTDNYLKQSY